MVINDKLAQSLYTAVLDIVDVSRNLATMDLKGRSLKAGEELGELSTAVLITVGDIKHKKLPEPLSGEVADLAICDIDILAKAHEELNPEQVIKLLVSELVRKTAKWKKVLTENP